MSDTEPSEPSETEEWVQDFVTAIESRFPISSEQEPSPGEPAPGDDQPVEGQEPSSPEPPAAEGEEPSEQGEPTGEEAAQSTPAFTLSGVDYTAEQLGQMVPVYNYFNRLSPDQIQAIDALMSGQYVLAPAQAQPPTTPSPVPAPSPSPQSASPEDEGEWLDPRAQAEIRALRQEIGDLKANFQQNLTPVVQQQQQTEYNARLASINTAADAFKKKYDLSTEAMQALETSIHQAGVFPDLAKTQGSAEAGMTAALEMMFWTTPTYRDPYVQQRVTSQQAEQAEEEARTIRKQHLTALSGSGGSAPRREPVPSSPEDRHAAMVAEINAAMNGSGQVQ